MSLSRTKPPSHHPVTSAVPLPAASWVETVALAELTGEQLTRAGVVFRCDSDVYRTLGRVLGQGGMGVVYELERRADGATAVEPVVGKVFRANHLFQLRTDEVTRSDHESNVSAIARLSQITHQNILPIYVTTDIADNVLMVTPRMGTTLLDAIDKFHLSPRARVHLLLQALDGLARMHLEGFVHRDFTLRNVLLNSDARIAALFDFDLAMDLRAMGSVTYREHYRGRVFGSPGYSVAPETVDQSMQDCTISPTLDIYAVGGALHALFTDQLVYGDVHDMWALLVRIGEGVVVGGRSTVFYPDSVPVVLRPIIERCLERDPALRFANVAEIIAEIHRALPHLEADDGARTGPRTSRVVAAVSHEQHISSAMASSGDPSVTRDLIDLAERAVSTWGYSIDRSLGRVKQHPIFLATPRPEMLADGTFPDSNTFPKLVTLIEMAKVVDRTGLISDWQQHFLPILRKVRTGLLTSLHNVIYDANTKSLLLFSEYVAEPRFGDVLADFDMPIDGALALGFVVIRQVAMLHEQGMAHNNIHAGALLLKGAPATRAVLPAMIGLVEPAMGATAMAGDTRALAGLVMSWLRPTRIASLAINVREPFVALRSRLSNWVFDPQVAAPRVDELVALASDALALLDYNFAVLRDSGGDIEGYALLLVSVRFYHLLWT